MQESFTEEPFMALMMAGAMTSMPSLGGAANADGFGGCHRQSPWQLSPCPPAALPAQSSPRGLAMPSRHIHTLCIQPGPEFPCPAGTRGAALALSLAGQAEHGPCSARAADPPVPSWGCL